MRNGALATAGAADTAVGGVGPPWLQAVNTTMAAAAAPAERWNIALSP
jgi:hypothetical protein